MGMRHAFISDCDRSRVYLSTKIPDSRGQKNKSVTFADITAGSDEKPEHTFRRRASQGTGRRRANPSCKHLHLVSPFTTNLSSNEGNHANS
jgi:hypothetical protein